MLSFAGDCRQPSRTVLFVRAAFHAGDHRFESGWGYLLTKCLQTGRLFVATEQLLVSEPVWGTRSPGALLAANCESVAVPR
jgi:hypothetical protein